MEEDFYGIARRILEQLRSGDMLKVSMSRDGSQKAELVDSSNEPVEPVALGLYKALLKCGFVECIQSVGREDWYRISRTGLAELPEVPGTGTETAITTRAA